MPLESTRRVIRSSKKSPEHHHTSSNQEGHSHHVSESKIRRFNDDIESDETVIFDNSKWKEYEKFIDLLDEIKILQNHSAKQVIKKY
jgi:hypothetical protein